MWPKQADQNIEVKGYGDLSAGQRPGILSNVFSEGDFINVEQYDHMSLYCYLQKQLSGTIDDVIVQIEKKPLKSVGYATEQSVSYSTSGSISEARLRDLQYRKEIDYRRFKYKRNWVVHRRAFAKRQRTSHFI